ncbi:hypothetical protein G647_01960 [Cladophialophora carrionii CBS 160.54]|uniref:Uncharacterized protein n=1 Tax=Cladophialophora carrionii CBS 160.54 TaxID=1279043 RepID=V9DU26_9EURO|nr:uncharacterized protein G647_01960 [Cladophialophora carrionii CBS 160.54]ETI29507.1 hypothetical protein G647_01960 [Cladophialophora carrionii CBS 160.54]
MADTFVDPTATSDQSPWSILNKLPTKRIDAAITRAAQAGIPEQAGQTGGYAPGYLHLSHIPLFPLYSAGQHELLAKEQKRKESIVKNMDATDPDKNLTGGQKAFLSVLGHVTGGGSIVSAKRWERRLEGASVWTSNNLMQQNKLVVFTRWAVPSPPGQRAGSVPWFVDVIEHRFLDTATGDNGSTLKRMGGNVVMLKVGIGGGIAHAKKVTLQLLKTEAKGLKTQKTWTKRLNFEPCEAMTFVGDSEILAMEIVARVQRACSSVEAMEIQKRFDKEWMVPLMQ